MTEQHNWAGNYRYQAAHWHTPSTLAEVQELVARCEQVKTLGTRHSFNGIADTDADMLSLACFDEITLNRERHTVTVGAGVPYGRLGPLLHDAGYAVHNLASLPHISVVGACATATHGSGDRNPVLASAVSALELALANGAVRVLSRERDGEEFFGAIVGLGALGVVTQVTLDLLPTFAVRQDVYENLPLAQLEDDFDAITSGGYSVSLFTDWRNQTFTQVWRKRRVENDDDCEAEADWFGATRAARPLHPIAGVSAENCTLQGGVPGPWQERLPHFRMDYTPSSGDELQSEYLIPRPHALSALRAVFAMQEQISPLLLISEVRTVAADGFWMSPCYGQECVALHFTWKPDWTAVRALLPQIEAALAPFSARPHWGKLFTLPSARLQALYPKLPDFQRLRHACDPQGKFRNAFLDATIGP